MSGRAALSYDDKGGYEPNSGTMDKFLLTTSSAPLAAGFTEAIRFHQEMGSDWVESRALALSKYLKKSLSEVSGVEVVSPTEDRASCGLTSFQVKGMAPDDVVARMWDYHRIVVRQVSELKCVRAATHAFNTEDEVDKLVDAIRGLVG